MGPTSGRWSVSAPRSGAVCSSGTADGCFARASDLGLDRFGRFYAEVVAEVEIHLGNGNRRDVLVTHDRNLRMVGYRYRPGRSPD